LDELKNFYKLFSFSIFGFITLGTKSICNIDSYFYSSIQGTLESIQIILKNGRINDAYALLRKYYDSTIINIYSNLYLKDNHSLENFIVEKIDNWTTGTERLPEYRIMSQYITNSDKLGTIYRLLNADERYKKIRDRCNNHTHYNFYYNALLNDNEIYLPKRTSALNTFSNDIEQIFILHLSCLFYLSDHYMMSSDYSDYMDMGLPPEEGCEYNVAPFVQNVFNNYIKNTRPEIAKMIEQDSKMKLH
jgi:hypothetical protein